MTVSPFAFTQGALTFFSAITTIPHIHNIKTAKAYPIEKQEQQSPFVNSVVSDGLSLPLFMAAQQATQQIATSDGGGN